ncbi:MAG: hypothetical protein AAFY53_12625 [Pseudomonadota bacterium]
MTIAGTLARIVLVPLGLILAAAAAGFVLVTLGSERFIQEISNESYDGETLVILQGLFAQGAAIVSAVSVIPALGVVIIGEVARIKSLLYYMVGGGLAIASAPLLAGFMESQALAMPNTTVLQIAASAGFFGGFVYWLIAGRSA